MCGAFRWRLRKMGSRLAGCLLLVVLATAGCGGEEDSPIRTPDRSAQQPTSAPTTTPFPPPEGSNHFIGTVNMADPTGDVEGSGETPAGIDLTGARIVSSKGNLILMWYTSEQASTRIDVGETARWVFELSNGDQPVYDITFQVTGKEWDILFLDRETGEETKHRIGSVYRDRLDVPYPARDLPKLQPSFTWTARSHYTDATGATWDDVIPDDGGRLPYPN
jgi:hypothetical protein